MDASGLSNASLLKIIPSFTANIEVRRKEFRRREKLFEFFRSLFHSGMTFYLFDPKIGFGYSFVKP